MAAPQPETNSSYLLEASPLFREFADTLQSSRDVQLVQDFAATAVNACYEGHELFAYVEYPLYCALWFRDMGRFIDPPPDKEETASAFWLRKDAHHYAHDVVQRGLLRRIRRRPEGPLERELLMSDAYFTEHRLRFEGIDPSDTNNYLGMQAAHLGRIISTVAQQINEKRRP